MMQAIKLSDATDEQILLHYRQANIKEFQQVRSSWFLIQGTFKNNPFADEYREWLKQKGISTICLEI